jgi:hypothetical protein
MKKLLFLLGLFIVTTNMVIGRDSPSMYDRMRDRSENQYIYSNSARGYYDGGGRQFDMTMPSNWDNYRTYDWQPGKYNYDSSYDVQYEGQ